MYNTWCPSGSDVIFCTYMLWDFILLFPLSEGAPKSETLCRICNIIRARRKTFERKKPKRTRRGYCALKTKPNYHENLVSVSVRDSRDIFFRVWIPPPPPRRVTQDLCNRRVKCTDREIFAMDRGGCGRIRWLKNKKSPRNIWQAKIFSFKAIAKTDNNIISTKTYRSLVNHTEGPDTAIRLGKLFWIRLYDVYLWSIRSLF